MAASKEVLRELGPIENVKRQQLVDYLKARGVGYAGNKSQLYELALCAEKLGLSAKKPEHEDARATVSGLSLRSRLETPTGETLPEPSTLNDWNTDSGSFPTFSFKELYNYLVLSKHRSMDGQKLQANKETRAEIFYRDGHVQNIRCHKISDSAQYCFVAAEVLPSVPTQDAKKKPAYTTWVSLAKVTSCVNSAFCACVAGEGESCNHVGAVLFALKDITDKLASQEVSCTSQACTWIKPRKRRQSPRKADRTLKRPATCPVVSPQKPSAIEDFKAKLRNCFPKAGFLLNEPDFNKSVPPLCKVDFMFRDSVNLRYQHSYFKEYMSSLRITEQEIINIFQLTLGQSSNSRWKEARLGRLTASVFGRISKQRPNTAPDALLRDIFGYSGRPTVEAMQYGLQEEGPAIQTYVTQIRQMGHTGLTVRSAGLMVHPKFPYLGASPDGLISCNDCGGDVGLIEIKSPFAKQMLSPEELCLDKAFYCELIDGKVTLKRSSNHYYQVQGQLACSGRKWCDFCVFTKKGLSMERIYFDETFFDSCLKSLQAFYCDAVLPELFSRRLQRGKPLF